jgi:hypothetical protein
MSEEARSERPHVAAIGPKVVNELVNPGRIAAVQSAWLCTMQRLKEARSDANLSYLQLLDQVREIDGQSNSAGDLRQ